MSETATEERKDKVPSQYREKYKATGGTCGDFIAVALQKVAKDGIESLGSVKAENKIEAERWAGMNPGMQRMNLANVLRGRFLKGETILILGKQFDAKHQAEDFNGTIAEDDKTLLRLAGFLELQENERTVASLRALFFPKAKGGKTAEEKAAEKAERDAAKAKDKADKKAAREAKLADEKKAKALTKLADKLTKAKAKLDAANTAVADAQTKLDAADEAGKAAAQKAKSSAVDKLGKIEDEIAAIENEIEALNGDKAE